MTSRVQWLGILKEVAFEIRTLQAITSVDDLVEVCPLMLPQGRNLTRKSRPRPSPRKKSLRTCSKPLPEVGVYSGHGVEPQRQEGQRIIPQRS